MSNTETDPLQESIAVLFHACLLGRADVIKSSITSIKQLRDNDEKETCRIISKTREEDGATALHVATVNGHVDAVRTLLVCLVHKIMIIISCNLTLFYFILG